MPFRLASRVLCATLAVPLPVARNQSDQLLDLDDGGVEKQKRLANLLSLSYLPTRQTLVKELVSEFCLLWIGSKTWGFSNGPFMWVLLGFGFNDRRLHQGFLQRSVWWAFKFSCFFQSLEWSLMDSWILSTSSHYSNICTFIGWIKGFKNWTVIRYFIISGTTNCSNYADTAVCLDSGTVAVQIRPNVLYHCSVTKRHTDKQTILLDAADAADMLGIRLSATTDDSLDDATICGGSFRPSSRPIWP